MKRRWNFPRKPTPRASPSSGRTHPFPATSCGSRRPALPSHGEHLTATSVFGCTTHRGFSPADPLFLPCPLLAILHFQRCAACSSACGSRAAPPCARGLSVLQAAEWREAAPGAGLSPPLTLQLTRGERGTCVWLPPPSCRFRRRRRLAARSAEFCT